MVPVGKKAKFLLSVNHTTKIIHHHHHHQCYYFYLQLWGWLLEAGPILER